MYPSERVAERLEFTCECYLFGKRDQPRELDGLSEASTWNSDVDKSVALFSPSVHHKNCLETGSAVARVQVAVNYNVRTVADRSFLPRRVNSIVPANVAPGKIPWLRAGGPAVFPSLS